MTADVVAMFLDKSLGTHEIVALPGNEQRELVSGCAALGIAGGAIYDALIGASCARAG